MGLDMYGLASRYGEKTRRFAYWREHSAPHGWMERLYRERGGTEVFNSVPLPLTRADLDRLEADVKARRQEPTAGSGFGSTESTARDRVERTKDDLAFIAEARELIAREYSVTYESWW